MALSGQRVFVIAVVLVALVGGALAARALLRSDASRIHTTTLVRTQLNLLDQINRARVKRGLLPLRPDARLSRLAAKHTQSMILGNYFAHDEPRGRSFNARATALRRRVVGENLAWGTGQYATARGTLILWLNSPPHRKVLLTPAMRRIGIAVLRGGPYRGQSYAIVTTADFSS